MDWTKLRDKFYRECTDPSPNSGRNAGIRPINMTPHNLFEWFKDNIETSEGDPRLSTESKCNKHDVNGWRSLKKVSELKRGDIIKNKLSGYSYVVDGTYGERASAIKVQDITNPSEWMLLACR